MRRRAAHGTEQRLPLDVWACAVACLLALSPRQSAADAIYEEYRVKSGFVLNFIKFTVFNDERPRIKVCLLADGPIQKAFAGIDGAEVPPARISLAVLGPAELADDCQVAFISGSVGTSARDKALAAWRGKGVLTIGETEGFLESGGVINLYPDDKKIRFEICLQAAEREGLRLSSKLLMLARIFKR